VAGIGFDLRRLVQGDAGLLSRFRAYAAAGMIAAGPWLITMASLWLVRSAASWLRPAEVEQFLSIVGHVFALSLITVGGLQMAVTRHLADLLFVGRYGELVPAFSACTVVVAAVQSVTGLALGWLAALPWDLVFAATLLYVAVSLSWLAMVWLTVVRQYDKILLAYLLGAAAFQGLLFAIGPGRGLAEVVAAYAGGMGLVVVLMTGLVVRGTERAGARSCSALQCLGKYRTLALVGTVYGLSLWSDKLVFWFLDGVPTLGNLRHHPLYDACFYLGYLTVVPALAVNLVHLETDFYAQYRAYYAAVTGDEPLREIRARQAEMEHALREAAAQLLRVQGFVTGLAIVFATPIVRQAGLPDYAARTFRIACLGSFCQVLLLLAVLILLYFDRRRAALRACVVFFLASTALAGVSVAAGPDTYGVGFVLAALAALAVALLDLRATLARLDYLTFTQA
jgi:uncharacterized membrane protein